MNVPLAVKMTIQERRIERRQGQRRQLDRDLAETLEALAFMRGVVIGTLGSALFFSILWAVSRLLHV